MGSMDNRQQMRFSRQTRQPLPAPFPCFLLHAAPHQKSVAFLLLDREYEFVPTLTSEKGDHSGASQSMTSPPNGCLGRGLFATPIL